MTTHCDWVGDAASVRGMYLSGSCYIQGARPTGASCLSIQWRTASGMWFGETPRQSQAKPVKQQHTRISPNHVPEAVSNLCEPLRCLRLFIAWMDFLSFRLISSSEEAEERQTGLSKNGGSASSTTDHPRPSLKQNGVIDHLILIHQFGLQYYSN